MIKTKQIFNISATAQDLVPDKFGRMNYILSLSIALVMAILIAISLAHIPSVVPIFFTLPWGETRLASQLLLYLFPAIIFIFTIINLGLGRIAAKLSPLLPKVLAVTTSVVAIMFLIAIVGIVQSLVL